VLSSYDTRLWVDIILIPVIPLGKKRIIDQCPACTRHAVMNWGDWEQGKKRTSEAVAAYRRKADDPQLAEDALKLVVAQRDVPAFLELAPDIERGMKSNARPLAMTASVYELFNRIGDAERCLRAALEAAKDDEEERNGSERLADNLLRQNRPEEAEPLLQHIVVEGIPDRVDAIYHLGQAYQRKGNHEKAVAAFDQCQIIFPQIAKDQVFNQLRDASLKAQGTGKAVDPGKIVQRHKNAASRRRMAKVVPVVVLLAVGAYCALSWIEGMKAPVWFVNALDHPYDVKVNGVSYSLPGNRATKLRLPEGQLRIEMPGLEAETVTVESPFASRPFDSTLRVINPDGSAVLARNKAYYGHSGSNTPRGQSSLFTGRTYYTFDGIDYPFQDFPHSLETKSGGGTVSRDNLELAWQDHRLNISQAYLVGSLSENLGPDVALRVLQRRALLEKDRDEYLDMLREMMKPEDLAGFIGAHLAEYREDVWWQREYQYALDRMGRSAEAEKFYREMLDKEPGNKTLKFLAGNASRDLETYLKLAHEAAALPDPCPHAFTSLAKYYLSIGEPSAAAMWADKAMQGLADDTETRMVAVDCFIADRQFERAMSILLVDENAKFPYCVPAILASSYAHCLKGDSAVADDSVLVAQRAMQVLGDEAVEMMVARLNAERRYVQGDVNGYATELAKSSAPQDAFERQVALGNLEAAASALKKIGKPGAEDHLLMYITATHQGDVKRASYHLENAVGLLAKGDAESRAFAAALSGTDAIPVSQLGKMRGRNKLLPVTALGIKDASVRKECFEIAAKLNYQKKFPQHLIAAVLAGK
jgi:tetratricopeptide (TPR) repeat protein